jgi:hypothetical protein
MNATSDRAYFNVQDQLNTLDIRAPIIQWLDHFTQLIHGGIFQPGKASSWTSSSLTHYTDILQASTTGRRETKGHTLDIR